VLAVLDAAAAAHEVPVAAVSLAWLAAQPTVVSPIASARTPGQLAELMAISDLELTADELRALDDASASSAVAQDGGALGQDRDLGGGEDLVV
jgi:aryl-alcohol dehydrogenase-like predicted oxidoreductase